MLMAKLGFLKHGMSKRADVLCGRVVLSLCDNFDSSCLVRECRELEEPFGTDFTGDIVCRKTISLKVVKKLLYEEGKVGEMQR